MSAALLRILVLAVVGAVIFFGVRRIWRDWSNRFRQLDAEDEARLRARDRAERRRPDVIELKRDEDGTYRPEDDGDRDGRS